MYIKCTGCDTEGRTGISCPRKYMYMYMYHAILVIILHLAHQVKLCCMIIYLCTCVSMYMCISIVLSYLSRSAVGTPYVGLAVQKHGGSNGCIMDYMPISPLGSSVGLL